MNNVDELLGCTAPIVNDLIVSERKNVVVCRSPFDHAGFSNPFLILRSDFFTGDYKEVSSISVYVMAKRIMIGDNYTIKSFLSGSLHISLILPLPSLA